MAVTDTSIYNWLNDYGGADTNTPGQTDAINNNLDDELRNLKSVSRAESINKQWERHRGLYGTLTFVDVNTFTLSGDRTSTFLVGRRIKATVTAGTVYGRISASSHAAGTTTVDVVLDSGDLDAGLSEVQLGALTTQNPAIPDTFLRQHNAPLSATASGTDTYTATLTPPITSYIAGQFYVIQFTNANTGAATLNLNSLGAKTIKTSAGAALTAGLITAAGSYLLIYDGTDMRLIGTAVAVAAGSIGATEIADNLEISLGEGATVDVGGGTGTATLVGRIESEYTTVATDDGTEKVLRAATLAANVFNADGRAVRLVAWGRLPNSNANQRSIRIYLGGTKIIDFIYDPGSSQRTVWTLMVTIVRTGSNTQRVFATFLSIAGDATETSVQTAPPTAFDVAGSGNTIPATQVVDSALSDSGSLALELRGDTNAATAGDVACDGWTVEILN